MTKYLRSKINGVIADWHERLADNKKWEVVTEQEAFPERFAPVDLATAKSKVDISVPADAAAEPITVPPELAKEGLKSFEAFLNAPKTKKTPKGAGAMAGIEGKA